jgi:putative transposase
VRGRWEALAVSESGDHAGVGRPDAEADRRRAELVAAIAATHAEVQGRYGSPRMTAAWDARGDPCAEKTVAKLMRIHLDRDFEPPGPNPS